MGIREVLSAPRSPWHRAYIEGVIGSIRRECLDHGIVFHVSSAGPADPTVGRDRSLSLPCRPLGRRFRLSSAMKIVFFQMRISAHNYVRFLSLTAGQISEVGVEVSRLSPGKRLRSNTDGDAVLWASSVICPAIRGVSSIVVASE